MDQCMQCMLEMSSWSACYPWCTGVGEGMICLGSLSGFSMPFLAMAGFVAWQWPWPMWHSGQLLLASFTGGNGI